MPYISTDAVREKRQELKAALPEFKLSVRKGQHGISVSFVAGPDVFPKDYIQVNHFYIDEYYEGRAREVLNTAYDIARSGQRLLVEDMDYGRVPTFYVNLNVGSWDKPYEVR